MDVAYNSTNVTSSLTTKMSDANWYNDSTPKDYEFLFSVLPNGLSMSSEDIESAVSQMEGFDTTSLSSVNTTLLKDIRTAVENISLDIINSTSTNITESSCNGDAMQGWDVVFEFVFHGVFLNCVGLLGLVGNLLSIFILSRPQMKGSTNCILIGLATYDTILIITRYCKIKSVKSWKQVYYSIILLILHLLVIFFNFSILMFGLPAIYKYSTSLFTFYNWEIFPYITPCVYAIGLNAQTTSAYLTLCVTLERYVAVCRPLKVWLIKSSMFCKCLK